MLSSFPQCQMQGLNADQTTKLPSKPMQGLCLHTGDMDSLLGLPTD